MNIDILKKKTLLSTNTTQKIRITSHYLKNSYIDGGHFENNWKLSSKVRKKMAPYISSSFESRLTNFSNKIAFVIEITRELVLATQGTSLWRGYLQRQVIYVQQEEYGYLNRAFTNKGTGEYSNKRVCSEKCCLKNMYICIYSLSFINPTQSNHSAGTLCQIKIENNM